MYLTSGPHVCAAAAIPLPTRAGSFCSCSVRRCLFHVVAVARDRIDHGDLLDREVRHDLDVVLLHAQHLLDAHAVAGALAVLGLESEGHAFLDLDRMIERPDARDHRRIVLRKPEAVAPQVGGGLVLVLVAPGLHRGGPLERDVARGGADLHGADRVVEPLERGLVGVFLLLARLLADAIGAVIAGLVAVPGKRSQIHEHDVAGLDDAVGEVAPVRPGVGAGRHDHVLDVLHSGDVVEVLHQVRGHLVLGDAGAQELHAFPVRRIADRADDAEALLLVLALDRARFHHRGHAVDPVDVVLLEDVDHVDVDEVDAELLPGDAVVLHRLDHRLGELGDLLHGGRTGRALDPGERVPHVLLWNPRAMALDLEAEVALLEQDGPPVAAQHGVAQAGLEPVPARRQRARDVADVLVIHAQHRAEAVLLHHRARALDAVFAQPIPVDALLPVEARDAEICRSHAAPPRSARAEARRFGFAYNLIRLAPVAELIYDGRRHKEF